MRLQRYDQRLRRFGLRDSHLDWDVSARAALTFGVREGLAAIVLLPVAAAGLAIFWVPYHVTGLLARRATRERDVAATATVFVGTAVYTMWLALIVFIAWLSFGARASAVTALAVPLLAVAGLFAIEREAAAIETARSWLMLRRAKRHSRAWLKQARSEIADLLEQVYEWLSAEKPGQAAAQKPH
jgi:hypothetical protein